MKLNILKSVDIRQSPEWGDYMESIGFKVKRLNGQNIFIRRMNILNRSIIKIQHTHGPLDLKEIDKIAKEEKALFVIIEPHSWGYSNQELIDHGYRLSKMQLAPSATIKIDLTLTKEKLFSSFSENAKRNIKKAKVKNISVKLVDMKKEKNMDAFEEFFKLQINLTKLKKFYAPGYKESMKKMDALKNNSILAFAYDEDNIPIATVWFAIYKKTIAYIQTGITEKGYENMANYLLVWEGLIWAKKNKLEVFDFESIYDSRYKNQNKRWIGYSEFKKRFHGEIVNYPPTYAKYHNPVFKFLEIFPR